MLSSRTTITAWPLLTSSRPEFPGSAKVIFSGERERFTDVVVVRKMVSVQDRGRQQSRRVLAEL